MVELEESTNLIKFKQQIQASLNSAVSLHGLDLSQDSALQKRSQNIWNFSYGNINDLIASSINTRVQGQGTGLAFRHDLATQASAIKIIQKLLSVIFTRSNVEVTKLENKYF